MGTADGHYFAESPTSRSKPGHLRLVVDDEILQLETDAGTFSPRRIDSGTAFLLADAPAPPPTGTFLDLGSGYGPIALTLARRSPDARVVAVEVNERSRDLCVRNAEAAGCANVEVLAPADVDPELRFDLIWSNPPIRIGKDRLHALLLDWLPRLAADGRAILVVGKNLGADSLQRWLTEQGYPTDRLASKRGYRLLSVSRD